MPLSHDNFGACRYNFGVPLWLKTLLGLGLVPLCIGAVSALVQVFRATGNAEAFWVAFAGGALSWVGIYLLLPKPMRIYVFGHELTHVLWTWAFGGKVKKFKATAAGGHVVITKSNFLIVLAPYFFPLYAILVVGCYLVGDWIWDLSRHQVWFHLLVGAAYAFHVTLTWHALQSKQTDITSQGYIFSAVVIVLGNVSVLLLGIPVLTGGKVSVLTALSWWFRETGVVLSWVAGLFGLGGKR